MMVDVKRAWACVEFSILPYGGKKELDGMMA